MLVQPKSKSVVFKLFRMPYDIAVKMRKSSSAQYLSKSVLDEADSIEPSNFTSISGGLFLSLLAAWIIVFLCCLKVRTYNIVIKN